MERCVGLVFALVDWRVLVIISLSVYSIVQSSIQPFKLPHESTLDNMCVLLLVCLYAVHIGRDLIETTGIDERNVFLVIVLVGSTLTLVVMTVRGRYMTKRLIRFAAAYNCSYGSRQD